MFTLIAAVLGYRIFKLTADKDGKIEFSLLVCLFPIVADLVLAAIVFG